MMDTGWMSPMWRFTELMSDYNDELETWIEVHEDEYLLTGRKHRDLLIDFFDEKGVEDFRKVLKQVEEFNDRSKESNIQR